jgi:hypothetical protein
VYAITILPGTIDELLGGGGPLNCPCGASFPSVPENVRNDSLGFREGSCPSCHSVRLYGRNGSDLVL